MTAERYVTAGELAELMGVSVRTVKRVDERRDAERNVGDACPPIPAVARRWRGLAAADHTTQSAGNDNRLRRARERHRAQPEEIALMPTSSRPAAGVGTSPSSADRQAGCPPQPSSAAPDDQSDPRPRRQRAEDGAVSSAPGRRARRHGRRVLAAEWTTAPLWARAAESTNLHNVERTRAVRRPLRREPDRARSDDDVVAGWLRGGREPRHRPGVARDVQRCASGAAGRDADRPQPVRRAAVCTRSRGRKDIQPPDETRTAADARRSPTSSPRRRSPPTC